jgi:drug/metabolite transporter (DMT)-like permease
MLNNTNKYGLLPWFYICAIGTVLLWSSAYVGIGYAISDFSPQGLALLRFLSASLFLLLVAGVKRIKLPAPKDIPWFLLVGFIGFFCYNIVLNAGQQTLSPSLTCFLISTSPLISSFLGVLFLKEKPRTKNWLGLVISLAGILLITLSEGNFGEINFGIILILCASLLISIYNILQRLLVKKYSPLQITVYAIWCGTLFLGIFLPDLFSEISQAPPQKIVTVIYLGIFPAAIGYLLWAFVLSKAPTTSHAVAFMYITPFLTIILEWFLLQEHFQLLPLCGGITIICGVFITSWKKHKKNRPGGGCSA